MIRISMGHSERPGIYVKLDKNNESTIARPRYKRGRERVELRRGFDLLCSTDIGVVYLMMRVRAAEVRTRSEITLVANRKEHRDSFM